MYWTSTFLREAQNLELLNTAEVVEGHVMMRVYYMNGDQFLYTAVPAELVFVDDSSDTIDKERTRNLAVEKFKKVAEENNQDVEVLFIEKLEQGEIKSRDEL